MSSETLFRMMFLFLAIATYAVRIYYIRHNPRPKDKKVRPGVFMVIWAACLFVYPLGFTWFDHHLPVPGILRLVGLVGMAASLPLSIWVYETLGTYFTTELYLLSSHRLITSGPYRLVRHPMYATLFMCAISTALFSANMIVAVSSVFVVISMSLRIKREEAMLAKEFGDEYDTYRASTKALVPLLL